MLKRKLSTIIVVAMIGVLAIIINIANTPIKAFSRTLSNEIIFTFKEKTVLNRIVDGEEFNTRRFPEEFEIWKPNRIDGDNFKSVKTEMAARPRELIDFKFEPTEFMKINFIYKNHYSNKPIALE